MIIAARRLSKHFQIKGTGIIGGGATLKAVDDVNIDVSERSVVGVVGESGSGKSTLGRLLMALLKPTSGQVLFNIPDDILAEYDSAIESQDFKKARQIEQQYSIYMKRGSELKKMRREMGIVFQDPYSSLDPRMKVMDIVIEPMVSTGYKKGDEARSMCMRLLDEVGLPREFAFRYPHELSGGQRQRVALARAISTLPKFLVLDEPTSALDVSVQAQILYLLKEIKSTFNISMLLITHNIAVVAYMADYVNVMYAGKLMETGPKREVILSPTHPYTIALISAVPRKLTKEERIVLKGDPPNLASPPAGCRFHPRCPYAFNLCGWTSDEVATDLEYLLQGKYYAVFGGEIEVIPKDSLSLVVKGIDSKKLSNVIEAEKDSTKSLNSISSIQDSEGNVLVNLTKFQSPGLYKVEKGKKVSCLLYSPGILVASKENNSSTK